MRRIIFIFCFCVFLPSLSYAKSPASVLMAKAIQLLQENKKKEALKLLEKAFEKSNDPNEIRVIGGLILEASPLDYPKRDAYLRYLVKFAPDHPDFSRWLKELGDRALNAGKLDEAEDWYLRSAMHYPPTEKHLIDYQLAWVYWSKKQRDRSLEIFTKLFQEHPEMRENLRPDFIRLWWEMTVLSPTLWTELEKFPAEEKSLLLKEWLHRSDEKSAEDLEKAFKQMSSSPDWRTMILEEIKQGWMPSKKPCFLFQNFLKPEDSYPVEHLLECTKSKDRPLPERLLVFYETHSNAHSETLVWAHAELLLTANQNQKAAEICLRSFESEARGNAFSEFTSKLILSLEPQDFEALAQNPSIWEAYLRQYPNPQILNLLQTFKPEIWISFQEVNFPEKLDKDFWIRKTAWQADQGLSVGEIRTSLEKIFGFPLNPSEKAVQKHLQLLQTRASTQLPTEFNEHFRKEYDLWLADIDRSLHIIQGSGDLWKKLSWPFLQLELQRNLEALTSQIEQLQLPEEASSLQSEFDARKKKLKEDLQLKYQAVFQGEKRK